MKKLVWILVFTFGINVTAQKAVLSNFRIENSYKDRVYFDVKGDISGLTKQGFVISGKTISSINTSGNYFTVSSPFTFWDNNTIRLGENSDEFNGIVANPKMYNFTLSYIVNNIAEPTVSTNRYVAVGGNGNGTSEGNPASLSYMASNAASGQTWWIKAGNYGNTTISLTKNGTTTNPIKYIGYKSTPGDITSNYLNSYNDIKNNFSSTEMPTLTGSGSGTAITMGADYVILRNFQTKEFLRTMSASSSPHHFTIDNFNSRDNAGTHSHTGINLLNPNIHNARIRNSVFLNHDMASIVIQGSGVGYNLIDNIKSYQDMSLSMGYSRQDYHLTLNGSNNIIRNCHVENFNNSDSNTQTHGIGVKATGIVQDNNWNLIEKSTAVNMQESFYLRNYHCDFNVIKDCIAKGNGSTSYEDTGGIWLWGGTHYNIYERIAVKEMTQCGIGLMDNQETPYHDEVGSGNIVRNCTFEDVKYALYSSSMKNSANFNDNKFYNNTFTNVTNRFYKKNNDGVIIKNLEWKNNIFISISSVGDGVAGMVFDHNNFYNSWTSSLGTNSINVDPKFENISGGNFRLKLDSPLINKGKNLDEVKFDFDGNHRPQGSSTDIGAFEYQENTTASVDADAGLDQSICQGESVTLTASGGSTYSWNTGATTKSITVNPNETRTYTATVSEGSASDSDSVQVTVNSVTAGAGANQTITEGESVTLTANGGDSYVWNTGETTQSITITPTATTTYTVTAKKGDCEDTDTVQVTVNAATTVTANAGSDHSVCLGESVTLTASGGSTYRWNTGATTKSITVNPYETTTYTVTVSEGSTSDSDTVTVAVSSVNAGAGANKSITEGESVTLTASGGDSYVWNTGETTQSITITPTATTTYTVTAKKGDCEDTDTVQVTVNAATTVTANAGSDQTICQGESVTLTASEGSTYSWSTGATTKSITVNPNETTTYTVTVSEGSTSDSDTVTVAVSSVNAGAGANKSITEGESVTLTASGGDSYVWNTGETTQSITVTPTATTTYTVTAKQGDCEDTDTVQVTVNQNNDPTVTANAGSNQSICLGESITLTASGGSIYSWSTGATTKSITVNPSETITYTVTVSEGSASDSDSVQVTVNTVSANAGSDKTMYEGESVMITASGGDSYLWSTGATSKSITVSPQETQSYTLTAYKNGCEDTDTVQVTVNKKDTSPPPAKANAGENQTICLGDRAKLTASGGATYVWSTGETTKSIYVNPTRTTSYTVTATRGGVTNSDAVEVTVENCSAISEGKNKEEMNVYPNPTTGTISIKADNKYESLNLNIYSLNGSIVYSDVVQTNNNVAYKSVDLSNLSKGVYIVRMYNSDYHKVKRVLLY